MNSTKAERIIWSILRAHRLDGTPFRRQVPIGPYIADFVCHAVKLVIEIDGGQHFEPDGLVRDQRRDAFLKVKGFSVLRFNNHDVMMNRRGVAEVIAEAVTRTPSPPLPRRRGREQTSRGAPLSLKPKPL
jgi:very-short-patch-repair endonuclease